MELTCPKCRGAMHTYERNGVHVDQCEDCRGIFLDRGELERLVEAETAWHGGQRPAPQPGQQTHGGGLGSVVGEVLQQVRSQKHQQHGGHGYPSGYGQPRRKKSFLDDLFG